MGERISLLHVDSDEDFLSMASRLIRERTDSMNVNSVSSVEEAQEFLDENNVDCVLCDYEMPDIDGLEFLNEVRKDYPKLPFILLTGKGSEDLASEAISKGVTDYIRKEEFTRKEGIVCNRIENVVEKQRAQNALQESEEKYRTLIEQTQSAIYIYRGTEFLYFNQKVIEITGYSKNELYQINPFELIHPDDKENVKRRAEKRAKGEDAEKTYEAKIVTKNGEARHCKFSVRKTIYNGEEAFLGSVVDITEQKENQKELQKSKRKLEALFDNANDGILLMKDGEIVDFNDKVPQLLKAEESEVMNSCISDFAPEEQHDGSNTEDKKDKMLSKAMKDDEPVFIWTIKDKEGEEYQVEVSLTKISVEGEALVQAIVRDLSELQRVVEPLHNITRDLMKAKSIQEVLDIASEAAENMLGFAGTSIRRYNPENNSLELVSLGGVVNDDVDRPDFDVDTTPHGKAFKSGETIIDDIREDDEYDRDVFNQTMYVPIGNYGTMSAGIIESSFSERDRKLAEILAKNTESALEKVEIVEKLRESEKETEEKYSTLVEEANNAVTIFQDGKFVFANSRTGELVNIPENKMEEKLIGKPFTDFIAPEHREEIINRHKRRMNGEDVPSQYEAEALTADGERVSIELNLSMIEYNGEKAVMGIVRDISESKERERKMLEMQRATQEFFGKEDQEKISELAANKISNIFGFNIVTIHTEREDRLKPLSSTKEANKIFGEELIEYTKEDKQIWDAYKSQKSLKIGQAHKIMNKLPQEKIKSILTLPIKNHGVLTIYSEERNAFSSEDEQLGKLFSLSISAAMDRSEIEEKLKEERDRFAALFKTIPDPTAYIEAENDRAIVRSVNPAFEKVFGYSEDEVKGEPLDKYIVPEDKRDQSKKINREAQRGKKISREVKRKTKNGEKDFLLRSAGSEKGYAIYTDITDQKQREREINRQKERLEKFASVLSHDIRNPLNIAQGYVEIARESECEEGLDEIDSAHQRIENIVESMLEMARKGQTVTETEEVTLKSCVSEAWSMVSSKDADLKIEDDIEFRADRSRFLRILENMLRNAVEHGDTPVTIKIGALENNGFYIENSGEPIPDENKEEVFEYGFSGEGGTGFGLAIVKSIVDAHGWSINVSDSDLGGPRFEIELLESKL
jgi:PAS domain S-box-containing protein